MFLPLVSLFVLGLASFSVQQRAANSDIYTLPHPNCTVSGIGTQLLCTAGNYDIPGNFDLSLVPWGVSSMRLGRQINTDPSSAFRPERLSTIRDDAPSLNMSTLRVLALHSFQGTNGKRLPIEAFLVNTKKTLTRLELRGCKIGILGSNFLQGFSKLLQLTLAGNDISAIDISAFETRVSLADAALPVVTVIDLKQNEISTLDWAAFAPVAHSLKSLFLNDQEGSAGLTNLTLSKTFELAALVELELQANEMGFPSRAILDTLKITSDSKISFERNGFCPHDPDNTCGCCEAKDFVTWAHEVGDGPTEQKPLHLSFSCGNDASSYDWLIFLSEVSLPPKDQYDDCILGRTTSKRTIGTTTTKITTRTTPAVVDQRSSTSATPGTRPNQLVGSSPVPPLPGGSERVNRPAIGLCGAALIVILCLRYSL